MSENQSKLNSETLSVSVPEVVSLPRPEVFSHLSKIRELIVLAQLTGYIQRESDVAPTSLMLIAPSAHAKTSVTFHEPLPKSRVLTNLSSYGLVNDLLPEIERERLTHIILGDFTTTLARKKTVVDSLFADFNALIEEGYGESHYKALGRPKPDKPIQCGLIVSITPDFFLRNIRKWKSTGFAYRILPVSYAYSMDTERDINLSISKGINFDALIKQEMKDYGSIRLPSNPRKIEIEENSAAAVNIWIEERTEFLRRLDGKIKVRVQSGKDTLVALDAPQFRLHKQVRLLLKATALLRGKKIAELVDWAYLKPLLDYVSYPNQAKVI